MLLAVIMQNQPAMTGIKLAMLAVLLPYLAMTVGTIKLPVTSAKPRIDAGMKKSNFNIIKNKYNKSAF